MKGSGLVLKAIQDPGDSTYVIWAFNSSRPLHLFRTEQDLRDHLWAECERNTPSLYPDAKTSRFGPDARIERANAVGSSALYPKDGSAPSYGFEHKEWVVPAVGGWAVLQREDLVGYTIAILTGDREEAQRLVTLLPWNGPQ